MKNLKLTSLRNILNRYSMKESQVSTLLWNLAQEDTDEHYFAIEDCCEVYIIDGDLLQDTASAFHRDMVLHFSL